jgi:hypothetical protein
MFVAATLAAFKASLQGLSQQLAIPIWDHIDKNFAQSGLRIAAWCVKRMKSAPRAGQHKRHRRIGSKPESHNATTKFTMRSGT